MCYYSGCSRHMTGNRSYLTDYEEIDGGFVAFGGNSKGGKITGKGKIRTGKLDFEDVYFVKELKFNLFSVSQMCDKKNSVLFTDTACVVLSPDFKLTDEIYVLEQKCVDEALECSYEFNTCLFQSIPYLRFSYSKVLHESLEDKSALPISVIQWLQCRKTIKHTVVQGSIRRIPDARIRRMFKTAVVLSDAKGKGQKTKMQLAIVLQRLYRSNTRTYTIEEEVYVCQPLGFEDPQFPNKVYKVEKALYGLHQAHRAWYETFSTYLLENGFRRGTIDKTLFIKKDKGDILLVQVFVDDIIFGSTKKSLCVEFEHMTHKRFYMSSMGELTFFLGLQVKHKDDGIFISQDKYVADILKKFDFSSVKTTSTPIETKKALLKDEEAKDMNVHLYRSMIGSLMYLTASRPDIIYLKGQPKLGLWYSRDSPFDLEAFSNSDYAGASLERKSTTGGCQFLGKRLISWQCKKQTIVVNSTTEAEYVAAANYCGQNPVFHAKTNHIEIRHHFIRDSYEKRLIQVIKIHTDHNVADLLTKAFDVSSISNEFGVKTGGCKVNAARQDLVLLGEKKSEGNANFLEIVDFLTASSVHYALTQIHATVDGKIVVISESSVRSGLHFNDEDGITCLTNDAIFENLALMGVVRATTTAASLDATQASGNISKTQSTAMYNDPLSQEIGLGGNTPGSDEERIEQDDLMDFVPPTPHDSPLSGGHTPGSDEGGPNINELMTICTNLSNRVLALEQLKTTQDLVIKKLKKKVRKLEKKLRTRTLGMKLFMISTSKRKSLDEKYVSK
ncbi:putative ribonuclease H-like domain-containing protein [Tanacetum coccineum]